MNKLIVRISAASYAISLAVYFWVASIPSSDLNPVIANYIQWWYSQPLPEFEFWLTKVSMVALFVSGLFSIALVFVKRWAAIGFLTSVGFLFVAELFMSHYFPLSRLEATLEGIAAISFGAVLVMYLLESKLETFKV